MSGVPPLPMRLGYATLHYTCALLPCACKAALVCMTPILVARPKSHQPGQSRTSLLAPAVCVAILLPMTFILEPTAFSLCYWQYKVRAASCLLALCRSCLVFGKAESLACWSCLCTRAQACKVACRAQLRPISQKVKGCRGSLLINAWVEPLKTRAACMNQCTTCGGVGRCSALYSRLSPPCPSLTPCPAPDPHSPPLAAAECQLCVVAGGELLHCVPHQPLQLPGDKVHQRPDTPSG